MESKLEYSFDDEPISKFCYDLDNKRIQVYFKGYHDLIRGLSIDSPCVWVIENWEDAKLTVGDEQKRCDISKHVGIFSIILYLKYSADAELEMLVNTVDNRYLTLFFKGPKLNLIVNPPRL
jgi:hypothetical protein